MTRENRVCRERIVNISEVKMVNQNWELFMTQNLLVHAGYCVKNGETFFP
jgi:hypothetical protein